VVELQPWYGGKHRIPDNAMRIMGRTRLASFCKTGPRWLLQPVVSRAVWRGGGGSKRAEAMLSARLDDWQRLREGTENGDSSVNVRIWAEEWGLENRAVAGRPG
jgi:hypothetical protein